VAPPRSAAPPTAVQRTAGEQALAIEQRWLDSWFRGTPVLIVQRQDGVLAIDVPREFCFEPGRIRVKPPLAAVLDKVAESLRRRPPANLSLLAAPEDRSATTPLALQRAAQIRRHLRDRGVAAARIGEPAVATADAVQLRIGITPP
jgi:hypothetical protein